MHLRNMDEIQMPDQLFETGIEKHGEMLGVVPFNDDTCGLEPPEFPV